MTHVHLFNLQRCFHVDEFARRRCRAEWQRERSFGPRSPGDKCRTGGTSSGRGCRSSRRSRCSTDKFTRREATNASSRRFPRRSVRSYLRGVQHVSADYRNLMDFEGKKLRDFLHAIDRISLASYAYEPSLIDEHLPKSRPAMSTTMIFCELIYGCT